VYADHEIQPLEPGWIQIVPQLLDSLRDRGFAGGLELLESSPQLGLVRGQLQLLGLLLRRGLGGYCGVVPMDPASPAMTDEACWGPLGVRYHSSRMRRSGLGCSGVPTFR
jgi:hypothetical protein